MNAQTLETTKRYYRVDRRQIAFLRFIFEAYDGIAVVETLDARQGIVLLHVAPGCVREVDEVLQDLKKEIMIESTSLKSVF